MKRILALLLTIPLPAIAGNCLSRKTQLPGLNIQVSLILDNASISHANDHCFSNRQGIYETTNIQSNSSLSEHSIKIEKIIIDNKQIATIKCLCTINKSSGNPQIFHEELKEVHCYTTKQQPLEGTQFFISGKVSLINDN